MANIVISQTRLRTVLSGSSMKCARRCRYILRAGRGGSARARGPGATRPARRGSAILEVEAEPLRPHVRRSRHGGSRCCRPWDGIWAPRARRRWQASNQTAFRNINTCLNSHLSFRTDGVRTSQKCVCIYTAVYSQTLTARSIYK